MAGAGREDSFPQNWSADKIVHEVGDIATSLVPNGMPKQELVGFIQARVIPLNGLLMRFVMEFVCALFISPLQER